MGANIKNFNFNKLDLILSNSEYWDFYLAQDESTQECPTCSVLDECVLAEFEFFNENIFNGNINTIYSTKVWSGAKNDGVDIPTYGLTGIDNGVIPFIKDPVDYNNNNLVEVLTGTTLSISSGDTRLFLNQISGSTGNIVYPLGLTSGSTVGSNMEFKGGFYQGYYKLDGYNYDVLPNRVNKGMMFEFWLNKNDDVRTDLDNTILNDLYPNNKGIFMYLGTRAENKFWNQFEGNNSGSTCSNISTEFCTTTKESDVFVTNDNGYALPLNPPQIIFTEINNEFLLYGRANGRNCNNDINEGFKLGTLTACEVTGSTPTFTITSTTQTIINTLNPFLIYGRSKGNNNCGSRPSDGYGRETVCSFSGTSVDETELDKDTDIIDNALAFMIKDDGSIGYRLLTVTATCISNKTVTGTTVKEEFSTAGVIEDNEWKHVAVRWTTNYYDDCDLINGKQRTGRLLFYVNCRLKFVVEEFPEFIGRRLNEYKEKQVGVPFNISLGGGTQGLLESMTFDGQDPDDLNLTIENTFAGSFIGAISQFRIYGCDTDWCSIKGLCGDERYETCYLVDNFGEYILQEDNISKIIVEC